MLRADPIVDSDTTITSSHGTLSLQRAVFLFVVKAIA
jgi:hypothetical protein